MNITTALKQADYNRLDAEILLAFVLQKDRSYLRAHDQEHLTSIQQEQFELLSTKRKAGEPIAYLTGYREFWSLDLMVTPEVLIPRSETELLVETVLKKLPSEEKLPILDLGTGSGAIALALASERPNWNIVAVDKSETALNIAKKNAERLNMEILFIYSNWFEQVPFKKYAAIVSNPPYIAENDIHLLKLCYEPSSALISSQEGLADIAIIIEQAKNYLLQDGLLIIEHGCQQAEAVQNLFKQFDYAHIKTITDLANLPRATYGHRN